MSFYQDVLKAIKGNYYQCKDGSKSIIKIEDFGSQNCSGILFDKNGKRTGQGLIRTEELKRAYERVQDDELIKIGLLEKSAQTQLPCIDLDEDPNPFPHPEVRGGPFNPDSLKKY